MTRYKCYEYGVVGVYPYTHSSLNHSFLTYHEKSSR